MALRDLVGGGLGLMSAADHQTAIMNWDTIKRGRKQFVLSKEKHKADMEKHDRDGEKHNADMERLKLERDKFNHDLDKWAFETEGTRLERLAAREAKERAAGLRAIESGSISNIDELTVPQQTAGLLGFYAGAAPIPDNLQQPDMVQIPVPPDYGPAHDKLDKLLTPPDEREPTEQKGYDPMAPLPYAGIYGVALASTYDFAPRGGTLPDKPSVIETKKKPRRKGGLKGGGPKPSSEAADEVISTILKNLDAAKDARIKDLLPDIENKPNSEGFMGEPVFAGLTVESLLGKREEFVSQIASQQEEIAAQQKMTAIVIEDANKIITSNNLQAQELWRMAGEYQKQGDLKGAKQLRDQAMAFNENSKLVRTEALKNDVTSRQEMGVLKTTFEAQAQNAVSKIDEQILYSYGMQALQNLLVGDTALAGFVMSEYTGYTVEVVPRSDGQVNYNVDGQTLQVYGMADLVEKLRVTFDDQYRARIAAINDEAMKLKLETDAEIAKTQADTKVTKTAEGQAVISQGGNVGTIDMNTSTTGIDGVDRPVTTYQPVTLSRAEGSFN